MTQKTAAQLKQQLGGVDLPEWQRDMADSAWNKSDTQSVGIATPFSFQTTAQCADATALINQIMTATGIPTSYNANIAFAIKVGAGAHLHFVTRNGSFGDGEDGSYINASATSATRSQQVAITYPVANGTTILVYGMTFSPSIGA